MTCLKLNEGVYNKIESVLENPKPPASYTDQAYFKSIYGPATLMNDWFEKRAEEEYQKPEEMKKEPPISENTDKYREFCKTPFPDRTQYFNKIFDSYGLGQELLTDHLGFSFYDNYTTSYDLMFNHLKKGICGPFPRHYRKGGYHPETDLTEIFGNLTGWGLKEQVYKTMKAAKCKDDSITSETSAEFKKYDAQTVKKYNDFPKFNRVKAQY